MTSIRNPESLRLIWQQARFEQTRAETLAAEIERWDANIADVEAKIGELNKVLADLKAERAGKETQRALAADKAHDFDGIVKTNCAANGWSLPDVSGDIPLAQTGAFPAVPPPDATQVIPAAPIIDPDCRDGKCRSCMGGPCECFCHLYVHLIGQHIGVILGDGGHEIWGDLESVGTEGLALHDGRGKVNTFHKSAIARVLTIEPAALDQVAATPAAVTTPDAEAGA